VKNQNDMIIAVVAIVLGLIGFAIAIFTQREVINPPAPEQVVTSEPVLQGADVRMANSLPAAAGANDPYTGGSVGGGARTAGGGGQGAGVPTAAGAGGGGGGGAVNNDRPMAAGAGG
jgi:hypothetical protein